MNLLPFLLGATIVFWGWQTGLWILAIPLAIVYETARYFDWRWNFTTADFRQTSHVCTILLVGVLIYLLFSDRSLGLIFSFLQWLPVIFAPLLIAQTYSTSDRVDLGALLFFKDKSDRAAFFLLDLTYPYFAFCILAASAANTRDTFFYVGIVSLISAALIPVRSKRFPAWVFFILLLVATSTGTLGHISLHQLHLSLERNTIRFFYGFYRPHSDPNQVSTAIGDIGSVKQSNKIVLRVKPAPRQIAPQLLRRAVYNKYASGFWVAAKPKFTPITSGKNEASWILQDTAGDRIRQITVAEHLEEGSTLLKLPQGSWQVDRLPDLEKIERNQYGTVQILSDASFLSYQINYDPNLTTDSPPSQDDLEVIGNEQPALDRIVALLDLNNKTPEATLNAVSQFFNREFDYSLELTRRGNNQTPLSAFLLSHRSGHCEYFATATALLLRRVGIPTRYVVGYSVNELSKLEKQYVVRSRNAHAWTQVYIDGKWRFFDTTPPSWIAFENRNQSNNWQNIQDVFAWLTFQIARISHILKNVEKTKFIWLLIIPLGIILMREFTQKGEKGRLKASRINRQNTIASSIGSDSELYSIEKELSKLGWGRDRAETWQDWLLRLQNDPETVLFSHDLASIITLHYRYCFDPQGIDPQTREKLRSQCQTWLAKHQQTIASKSI